MAAVSRRSWGTWPEDPATTQRGGLGRVQLRDEGLDDERGRRPRRRGRRSSRGRALQGLGGLVPLAAGLEQAGPRATVDGSLRGDRVEAVELAVGVVVACRRRSGRRRGATAPPGSRLEARASTAANSAARSGSLRRRAWASIWRAIEAAGRSAGRSSAELVQDADGGVAVLGVGAARTGPGADQAVLRQVAAGGRVLHEVPGLAPGGRVAGRAGEDQGQAAGGPALGLVAARAGRGRSPRPSRRGRRRCSTRPRRGRRGGRRASASGPRRRPRRRGRARRRRARPGPRPARGGRRSLTRGIIASMVSDGRASWSLRPTWK